MITKEGRASEPAYLHLLGSGELGKRAEELDAILSECRLCPNECRVDRPGGERGRCLSGRLARVGHVTAHFGEEPPLAGSRGAGTIFFSSCTMRCAFCQNYQISQRAPLDAVPEKPGDEVEDEALAGMMLDLQDRGCHNIDLVTPTHHLAAILRALVRAAEKGLRLPLVYNTNAFDRPEILRLLDGVVDIYLPDYKYSDPGQAFLYSRVKGYPESARLAIKEMFRQVGPLQVDAEGLARRGVLVRHLVMPNDVAGTWEVLRFLAEEVSPQIGLSLMAQYNPLFRAKTMPLINRPIHREEYDRAFCYVQELGFKNVFYQEPEARDVGVPDFTKEKAFAWG